MREQLIQYVELLFAGAPDSQEIRAEILQNTLDRYDDLVAQGKSPEAAYRLAISGIGDISEILGGGSIPEPRSVTTPELQDAVHSEAEAIHKRILRAVGVALYILCPVPLFVLGDMGMDSIGLCGTLSMVAVATMLMILAGKKHPEPPKSEPPVLTPRQELRKSINSMIWTVGLVLYLILSFTTGAWHITWLIFPVTGAVKGLIKAILDLKEANDYEN